MLNKVIKILFLFFLALPFSLEAVSLSNSIYDKGSDIEIKDVFDNTNRLTVYHFDSLDTRYCQTNKEEVDEIGGLRETCSGDYYSFDIGRYSIIEHSALGIICNRLNYDDCKLLPSFINEFIFEVKKAEGGGGWFSPPVISEPTPAGGGGGPTAYRPEIRIISPEEDGVYGKILDINYEATDKNDELGQSSLGLPQAPVTIYYSKGSDTRQKVQLGANLPTKGVFRWDTKDLNQIETYRIIIEAKDNSGETGEAISGEFLLDHTEPFFSVFTEPSISKGENVKIIVESTKDLKEPPKVKVAQKDFNNFNVEMVGEGKRFEGVYSVIRGYDGHASITVSGTDVSGNFGDVVVAGGRFSVGIEPPPKPIILSHLDKDILFSGTIDVGGKARAETEVILSVNGKEKYSKFVDSEGNFLFTNIKLREDVNMGSNFLSIISRDAADNISESADISLKFNAEPEVFITFPITGQVLGTTTKIIIKASDKNRDKLIFDYEVSRDDGVSWSFLAKGLTKKEYLWDTTLLSDGEYRLRVTADDGTTKKQSVVGKLIIKNFLPLITFSVPEKIITNQNTYKISGVADNSPNVDKKVNIVSLEYSLDGGKNWTISSADDGKFDSPSEKFTLDIGLLPEGVHSVLFRVWDERGIFGRAQRTLIVDFGPPPPPVVNSFKDGEIVSLAMDEDRNLAGVQLNIGGTSEKNSKIVFVVNDKQFYGETLPSGIFSAKGVTIREHGNNKIIYYAEDEAGNKSQSSEMTIIYNNPPNIKFIEPRSGRGISKKSTLSFEIYDPDSDPIKSSVLSYKAPEATDFVVLDTNPSSGKFEFDASYLKEGPGYQLKIDASDGFSSSSKTIQFFVDTTLPSIYVDPIKNKVFKRELHFEASGYATDSLSGIDFVEYSLDEEHWWKAIITSGYMSKKAYFRIKHPFSLDDGEYEIKFRSVDGAGNFSKVWSESIVVDTMPPRIGGYELSYAGIQIYPENSKFVVLQGSQIAIRMSLEFDTKKMELSAGDKIIEIKKNMASGLWEGVIMTPEKGDFVLKINAEDIYSNRIEGKEIGVISVFPLGTVTERIGEDDGVNINSANIQDAEINVLVFDEDGQRFVRWPGEAYGIKNPISSDENGEYRLFLPAGKYKISVKGDGLVNYSTDVFSLERPEFIDMRFKMKKREGVRGFLENILEKITVI